MALVLLPSSKAREEERRKIGCGVLSCWIDLVDFSLRSRQCAGSSACAWAACSLFLLPHSARMILDEQRLLSMSAAELVGVDPVVMNLTIAKGIPGLESLDIPRYARLADEWAADIRK